MRAEWVKSHQAQCNTREARLNKVVDQLAGQQHGKRGAWAASETYGMLPNTQAQLLVAGRRYTGPINCKVQHHMYNKKAKSYVVAKLDLEGKEHKVDWTALGALHRCFFGVVR